MAFDFACMAKILQIVEPASFEEAKKEGEEPPSFVTWISNVKKTQGDILTLL